VAKPKAAKPKVAEPAKAKPKTIGERISGAFKAVTDVVSETGELRNKLEPPGVSETQ
jgi:hypothetical protein